MSHLLQQRAEIPVLVPLTAQSGGPVTLDQLKAHLEITEADWDDQLRLKLAAAVAFCEERTGLCAAPQTFQLRFDCWPDCGELPIPLSPVRDVRAVKYVDPAGVEQTLPEADWSFDPTNEGAVVIFADGLSYPDRAVKRRGTVRVEVDAGFDAAGASGSGDGSPQLVAPPTFGHAVLMLAAHLYNNREAASLDKTTEVVLAACDMLDQLRVYR